MKRRARVDRTYHNSVSQTQCWTLGLALKGLSTDADNEFPDNRHSYELVFLEFE